jgi:hypothetical protein
MNISALPSDTAAAASAELVGRINLAVTMVAALFGVVATPALAQNSESPAAAALMKSEAKTLASGAVTGEGDELARGRSRRTPGGRERFGSWKKLLGALKAGQWTWAKTTQGKDCHVGLRGKYTDGHWADTSDVDICTDKAVDLTN